MQPNTPITNEVILKKLLDMEGKMATKEGVQNVRNEMATKIDIADVRKEMGDGFTKVNSDIQSLSSATAKGFVGLEERLTKKIDNLNSKVDDVENNLTDQVEKLAAMSKEALEYKVDRLEYA